MNKVKEYKIIEVNESGHEKECVFIGTLGCMHQWIYNELAKDAIAANDAVKEYQAKAKDFVERNTIKH